MLGSLVIVFREVIEAGLIIGIVLAATRGVPERGAWVGLGIGVGAFGAGVVALFAEAISNAFDGAGQALFNASVLAVVLGLAVLREGAEVVLFLYGIIATGTSASSLFVGGLLGLAAGGAFTA